MSQGPSDLDERIAALSDEELLQMVGEEAADYRPEALEIARREMERRGLAEPDAEPEPGRGPWTCPKCGTAIEADYRACWQCGTSDDGTEDPRFHPADETPSDAEADDDELAEGPDSGVTFRIFRGGLLTTWETLFAQAAAFASRLPPDRLISISQSGDAENGVVTVWYREGPGTSADEREEPSERE